MATNRTHPLRDKRILCWAMYDWANSAYTTLLITVLVAYIQLVVFPVEQWGTVGAVVWAWGISASMLMGAILSPIVGALADAQANKRGWLAITALSGSATAILLAATPPSMYVAVVILFIIANLMLELSLGIYNGFLPEIASEHEMNAVSAWGYGLGYLGGGIALGIAMLILSFGENLGLQTMSTRLRACLVLMGAWWALFSLPAIIVLRDKHSPDIRAKSIWITAKRAVSDVSRTLRSLRSQLPLFFFLCSFLLYNDGVQTVISQSSTFALHELAFVETELMAIILMIQFLALPGSIMIGRCADWLGQKRTLLACLVVWSGVLLAALFIQDKISFWLLAVVIALVLGGTQSVSRSLMAVMTPAGKNAQYFGFFNLSGKATSFMGTFLFGAIIATTGSSRLAIVGLLPFFVFGALVMLKVRVQSGIDAKQQF